MRNSNLLFMALTIFLLVGAQQITEEATVVNIEVPVRVFDKGKFVDHLVADDFEVFENGKLQEIVAVYLVKKAAIERKPESTKAAITPDVSRNFILIFDVSDYQKRIDDALDYFFKSVLVPGDSVRVVTPLRTYSLNRGLLDGSPKPEIKNKLADILRKDIILAGSDYRSFCQQIETIVDAEGLPGDLKRTMCLEILRTMKELSNIDESRLLEISARLKRIEGQKIIFLFYQREALPIPPFLMDEAPIELNKDISFDVEPIKRAFSDASITIHFIFLTNKPSFEDNIKRLTTPVVTMRDNSNAIFNAFTILAKTTGGLTESSANAAFAFKRAMDSSENYYLLYYHPSGYKPDGKFREIKVKIKNQDYSITHRAGYIAD